MRKRYGCQKTFYSDNQILVSADVKLVQNRISVVWVMTQCSLVVSGYQCCKGKEQGDMLVSCAPISHSQTTRRRKNEDETMKNLWILLRMDF